MGECNFCTLNGIKRHAAMVGATVEVRPAPFTESGLEGQDGVDVLIWYKGDTKPTWAAWLMKLPKRCVC